MKTSIVCISILTLLCFCGTALCQKAASPQNTVKSSTVKTNQKQTTKPASSAVPAKTQVAKSASVSKPKVSFQLDKEVDLSALTARTTFEQALDILRNSTKPPTQIVVMWRQLEQAGIEPTSPIGVDGISKTTIGTALKTILNSVSSQSSDVDCWVQGKMIVIGSKQSKDASKTTQLYNISDLTGAASGAVAFGMAANPAMAGVGAVNQIQAAGIGYGGGYGVGRMGGISGNGMGSMGGYGMGGMGGYGMGGMGGYGMGGMGGYGMGGMGGYGMSGMGGYGMGGMGGGMGGMGGYGMGFGGGMTALTPQELQMRQMELKGLIQRTIKPGPGIPD